MNVLHIKFKTSINVRCLIGKMKEDLEIKREMEA